MKFSSLFNRMLSLASLLAVVATSSAAPVITSVTETGGDGTVLAQWTGNSFNGIAPLGQYTVPPFSVLAKSFVDRVHAYTNASGSVLIPSYLVGNPYIMTRNDNRENTGFRLDVTVSQPVVVYLLIDNRIGDSTANAGNPPFNGAVLSAWSGMTWVNTSGFQPVATGQNRALNTATPDELGIDEGVDGTINNWYSIYSNRYPAGTFTLNQQGLAGNNMYGVVVAPADDSADRPIVLSAASPGPNATNVALTTTVNLTLSNNTAVLNPASVRLFFDGSEVPATVTAEPFGATVFYEPAVLAVGSVHTIRLTYEDTAGPAVSYTNEWSFTTTTDVAGPSLVSAVPRDQAHKLVLTFSEALDKASAENLANYSVTGPGGTPLAIVSATLANNRTVVTLLTAIQGENTAYTVNATGIRDVVNNVGGGSASFTGWVLGDRFVLRELYSSVTTASLDALMAHPSFPAAPSAVSWLPLLETPAGIADNYAQRVSGLLIPPETGNYVFFLSSDDQSLFFLSTDANPANAVLLAQETSYTPERTWTGDRSGGTRGTPPSNISTNPVPLVAGQSYYFELIHREGTGGDSLALNWQMPSEAAPENATPTRISGKYIASYAPAASITITQQPANRMALQNQTATFSVGIDTVPAGAVRAYQWQQSTDAGASWSDIPGAINASYTTPLLSLSDAGTQYRVIAAIPGAFSTSGVATLSVSDDTVRPTLRYRADGNYVLSQVVLHFSELMDPNSAGEHLNYFIEGAFGATLDVLAAQVAPNGSNVVLTTSAQIQGERYVVTVYDVRDLVGNIVAPNMNGLAQAVFYAAGDLDFARIDIGPSSGRTAPGWTGLLSTTAVGAAGNYPATELTSLIGLPFSIAIDNVNLSGTVTGAIDWRDRGDSLAATELAGMAEDLIKNNAGVIRVTLTGLPAGTYKATSFHMDMTPGGANQSDNVRVFVNGVHQVAARGNADQTLALDGLNDTSISNSAAMFEFISDGSAPVVIHFDGTVNIARTDTETPLNGLWLQLAGGQIPQPTITLVAPTEGDLFAEGDNIVIAAEAAPSRSDDPIKVVEFFANGVKIGEATTAPYTFTWNNVPRGSYTVRAVVTDVLDSVVLSQNVNIVVDSTAPVLQYTWASIDLEGATQLTLQFDEPLTVVSATELLNYFVLEPGVEITGVALGRASNSVVVGLRGVVPNIPYTIEAYGLEDNFGNIAPITSKQFMLPIVQINYQVAGAPVPSGYFADEGLEFGDRGNGYSYGWSTNATDDTRDRNSAAELDQRYDTLVHLQRGQDMHVWELDLPNGMYEVFIAAGDPSNLDQTNNFSIEGAIVMDADGFDNYDQFLARVEVSDGRLTIMAAPGAFNSKIMFVHVAAAIGGSTTLAPLTIGRSGSNITIGWTGPGRLQEADSVAGPYSDVPGNPASGYTISATGPQKFYRLIQ